MTCGLTLPDNPFLDLLPTGRYTGPWGRDPRSGHLDVRTLNRPHAHGSISAEMWLFSRTAGWWMLKSIQVHPDDLSKLDDSFGKGACPSGIRQIIDSPFLSQSTVVRSGGHL